MTHQVKHTLGFKGILEQLFVLNQHRICALFPQITLPHFRARTLCHGLYYGWICILNSITIFHKYAYFVIFVNQSENASKINKKGLSVDLMITVRGGGIRRQFQTIDKI